MKKIKNIINEEMNTEKYDDVFIGELESQSVEIRNLHKLSPDYDYDKTDVNVKDNEIVIYWSFNMWKNRYGIEDFQVTIKNASGSFIAEILDDNDDVVEEREINLGDFDWGFEISELEFSGHKTLYISYAFFDFETKKCEVGF